MRTYVNGLSCDVLLVSFVDANVWNLCATLARGHKCYWHVVWFDVECPVMAKTESFTSYLRFIRFSTALKLFTLFVVSLRMMMS